MFQQVLPLLGIAAIVAMLRWISGLLVRLGYRLSARLIGVATRVSGRAPVRTLVALARLRFPRAVEIVHARFSRQRFSGLPLTLIVVSALYVAALLAGLVEELLEADELIRIDEGVNAGLSSLRTDATVAAFAWLTEPGGSAAVVAVAMVTTGFLWAMGDAHRLPALWVTLVGSQISTYAGKLALDRDRPEFVTEIVVATPSFPSGHATSAMAVYGFIAYAILTRLPTIGQRLEVIYWVGVLIGLVGFSRLVLSVHYASDVAAGFLVGGFWLLVGFGIAGWRRW